MVFKPCQQVSVDSGPSPETKVYWTRWYVAVIVALANVLNNNQWAYWGPIAQSAKAVYGWTDNTIFLLINIGTGAAFFSTLAGAYFVTKKGTRFAVLVCYGLMLLSTISKVITTHFLPATILIAFGQLFNGIANSITGAIPPAVSEVWFPVNERTSATAVVVLAAGLGGSASFIIGPLAVTMPAMNGSSIVRNETDISSIRIQLQHLNYGVCATSLALLLLCVVYTPAKPPTPPSVTAACDRYDFKQGILTLIRRPNMWHLGLVYGLALGSYNAWLSVLDIIVNPLGITQAEAGWMGLYAGVGGVLGGLAMGRVADIFKRRMKLLLVIKYILAALSFGWFTLQCNGILPRSVATLYASVIITGTLTYASIPLFIEIGCEASYPIAEGLTSGFLMMIINLVATIFLLINLIPNIGIAWMNWWIFGVLVATVPFILAFKVKYRRVDIDSGMS